MNASFEPLHLVNTYGAFGHITKRRYEIIIEGTDQGQLGTETVWQEYEFKAKPGNPKRRPPQIAPYHLRLDWLMWFAAMSRPERHPWLTALMVRMLENDRPTLKLLHRNPFPDRPPMYVRARLYHYRFTTLVERRESGAWWSRTLEAEYVSPLSLRAVRTSRSLRDRRERSSSWSPVDGSGSTRVIANLQPSKRLFGHSVQVAQTSPGSRCHDKRC
jgi:hypothetical protein